MVHLSLAATRDQRDYLDWLEAEYDIRIGASDLSDDIRENVDQYQLEFDANVRDFYDAADEIEKEAFDDCDTIEDDSADAGDKTDEVLREARKRILKEAERLAEKLNSLNLRFSQGLSSSPLPSIDGEVGLTRAEVWNIGWVRFQFLIERVQNGTATSNEVKEFVTLRREFFPEEAGDKRKPLA